MLKKLTGLISICIIFSIQAEQDRSSIIQIPIPDRTYSLAAAIDYLKNQLDRVKSITHSHIQEQNYSLMMRMPMFIASCASATASIALLNMTAAPQSAAPDTCLGDYSEYEDQLNLLALSAIFITTASISCTINLQSFFAKFRLRHNLSTLEKIEQKIIDHRYHSIDDIAYDLHTIQELEPRDPR